MSNEDEKDCLLLQKEVVDESEATKDSKQTDQLPEPVYKQYVFLSSMLLALSILVNVLLISTYFVAPTDLTDGSRSLYAELALDTLLPWTASTDYSSSNMTLADERWAALSADNGIIALDKDWATAKGLPPSTSPFPWDSRKNIYLLNGYHGIHCIAQIHLALREYRDGQPQSHTFEHSNHCLDWLRNDIMCRADDTPLYATNSSKSENGIGQYRQCRDWSKLEAWAKEHHACYRYGDFVVEDKKPSQLSRFQYCPDDSPYLPRVREYFGKGDDWFPAQL